MSYHAIRGAVIRATMTCATVTRATVTRATVTRATVTRATMSCATIMLLAVLAGCSGAVAPPQPEVNRNTADPFAAAADAAFKGDFEYVKACVQSDPRYVEGYDGLGKTLLHYAAEGGHTEMVRYLLENGASVFAEDTDGYSPFDAATNGSAPREVMELLTQAMNAG